MSTSRIASLFRGALTALAAMALYAISLGCFIALMLLVISMEEGGENLPSSSMPLTEAVVLLSQGIGFSVGAVTVGVMPLLLTVMLVALIAQCAIKAGPGILSWISGLVVWVGCNLLWADGTTVELHDPQLMVAVKTAAVWTAGYALGALIRAESARRVIAAVSQRLPEPVRETVRLVWRIIATMLLASCTIGLVTAVVWIVSGWNGMTTLFTVMSMDNGSRILTSIASLAWLPNLMIWAVSWISGAGFHIGDLGFFTMWVGQSSELPPLPVFGLLPSAVPDDRVRLALQCTVPALSMITALVFMLVPGPLRLRLAKPSDDAATAGAIRVLACHACALIVSLVVLTALSCGVYASSDGSLGSQRLKHVGVDVSDATRAIGKAHAYGFAAAWFAAAAVLAAIYGIHWIAGRNRVRSHDVIADDASHMKGDGEAEDHDRRPRTIRSDADPSKSAHKSAQSVQEEIDDSNESSD